MLENTEPASSGEQTLLRVGTTGEVTDYTIAARHIMRLTGETFVRSRVLKEVLDAIDMSRRVVGSRKQQDSLHDLSTFTSVATLVLVSKTTGKRVVAIFSVSKYYFL